MSTITYHAIIDKSIQPMQTGDDPERFGPNEDLNNFICDLLDDLDGQGAKDLFVSVDLNTHILELEFSAEDPAWVPNLPQSPLVEWKQ